MSGSGLEQMNKARDLKWSTTNYPNMWSKAKQIVKSDVETYLLYILY